MKIKFEQLYSLCGDLCLGNKILSNGDSVVAMLPLRSGSNEFGWVPSFCGEYQGAFNIRPVHDKSIYRAEGVFCLVQYNEDMEEN